MNELPAPVSPNEHAGRAPLVIHPPVLILSLGDGTTGHDRGIAENTDGDLVCYQRLEIHAPGLTVLQIFCAIFDRAARAVMGIVFAQDALQEGDIRLDDGLCERLDELHELALSSA